MFVQACVNPAHTKSLSDCKQRGVKRSLFLNLCFINTYLQPPTLCKSSHLCNDQIYTMIEPIPGSTEQGRYRVLERSKVYNRGNTYRKTFTLKGHFVSTHIKVCTRSEHCPASRGLYGRCHWLSLNLSSNPTCLKSTTITPIQKQSYCTHTHYHEVF